MKFGFRTPSLKKSLSARTTGSLKRAIKKEIIPGYGKKGTGFIKNPKKAMYNKVYNKTTTGCLLPTIIIFSLILSIMSFAHGGRTDSSGGHRDKNNVSGLGSYHYHHGYPAHLHQNGVCPYESPKSTKNNKSMSKAEIKKNLETLGYYGDNAIAEFQIDNGLVADGVAGKMTIKKIRELLGN